MKNINQKQSIKLGQLLLVSTIVLGMTACSLGTKEGQVKKEDVKPAMPSISMHKPIEVMFANQSKEMAEVTGLRKRVALQDEQSQHFRLASSLTQYRQDFTLPKTTTENYQHYIENSVKQVLENPVSTLSIDVDTGSYTNVRRMSNQGHLPPADSVRIEEFINYFDYDYKTNSDEGQAFHIDTAIATSPWAKERHILRIGIKGATPDLGEISGRNLVFLLDVSGSMRQANKLPLLTRSLELLTNQLTAQDRVSIVVYAGASGVVLEPTKGNNKAKIKQALTSLAARGGTNGQAGIQLAYAMAEQSFIKGGVNRVILATDGDFNVGVTNHALLIEMIKQKRKQGIALTTLGFGQGNYNDHLMEQLADEGNGNYAYIDNIHEARKVLVDEMNATLLTIAKDVKIQVEFNPEQVAEYRLLGYENRALKREDFNNDKVDAGEIGAGHTVTALYEVTLNTSNNPYLDQLRYQDKKVQAQGNSKNGFAGEVALVKLRYKPMTSETSQLITKPVMSKDITDFNQQSDDFRFASSVAGFAHLLKQSNYWQTLGYSKIVELAQAAKGLDEFGYRAEFINLVRTYDSLQTVRTENELLNTNSIEQGFSSNVQPKVSLLQQL